jgi:hypothetical protein
MMKKVSVIGIVFVILGILIAAGPHSIFHVCSSSMAVCNKTADVEIYIGLSIVLEGILIFFIRNFAARLIFSIAGIISGLFTILVPTVIVGVCANPNMACNRTTRPALIILGSFTILFSIIYIIYLIVNRKKYLEEGMATDEK